jgi:CheY-like chemotaxis protein
MTGKRILVVEDQKDLRGVLRDLLAGSGYAVLEAPDGQAAVAAAKSDRPETLSLSTGATLRRRVEEPGNSRATRPWSPSPTAQGISKCRWKCWTAAGIDRAPQECSQYDDDYHGSDERRRSELTFSTPTLAKMVVSAAKSAEREAQTIHEASDISGMAALSIGVRLAPNSIYEDQLAASCQLGSCSPHDIDQDHRRQQNKGRRPCAFVRSRALEDRDHKAGHQ